MSSTAFDFKRVRRTLIWRVDHLLAEMVSIVAIDPCRWREPLRVLLTHPRPPSGLSDFHRNMRVALSRVRYDEHFVDRIVAAVHATERVHALGELLAPIKIALLTFVGGISCRPSLSIVVVSKFVGWTDVDAPLHLSFSTFGRKSRPLPVSKEEAMASITVVVQRAVAVLLEESTAGTSSFAAWSAEECSAGLEALWLAYTYCEVGTACSGKMTRTTLRKDFEHFGKSLWSLLDAACVASAASTGSPEQTDRASAFGRLSLWLQASGEMSAFNRATVTGSADRPTHVVCRTAIPDSTEKYDMQEIARHRVLQEPLAIAEMPSVRDLEASSKMLIAEFPWASSAIDMLFEDLVGRANLGVRGLTFPATLLVGQPGAGKSRLARRIAEELDLPRLDVSLSGSSDTKLLGGTSRGWAGGRPSDLASLMARRQSASAIVLLDEIDKARDGHREGGGIAAYLLPLLEPETACRHYDNFLKTECDFSMVSWICTANRLTSIAKPLQTRLQIVLVPQPRREDLPVVCAGVIADLEQRWHVPSGTLPSLTQLQIDLRQIASARQARFATEAAVSVWARSVVRH